MVLCWWFAIISTLYAYELVELGVYYESLCPHCQHYISGPMRDAWQCKEWRDMVNIKIYPHGNSHEIMTPNGEIEFLCQHGKQECISNMLMTCVLNLVNFDQNLFMDFIIAFESALDRHLPTPYLTIHKILNMLNYDILNMEDINKCMEHRKVYQHQMAMITASTFLHYTPFITLNGVHTEEIQVQCQRNTLECTCKAYNGYNPCCERIQMKSERKHKLQTTDRFATSKKKYKHPLFILLEFPDDFIEHIYMKIKKLMFYDRYKISSKYVKNKILHDVMDYVLWKHPLLKRKWKRQISRLFTKIMLETVPNSKKRNIWTINSEMYKVKVRQRLKRVIKSFMRSRYGPRVY